MDREVDLTKEEKMDNAVLELLIPILTVNK